MSATESTRIQAACLEWVDQQLPPLLNRFSGWTVLVCADHGDCWAEDGLSENGTIQLSTFTGTLLFRVCGEPVDVSSSPSRFRSALSRLRRWRPIRF